jgi:hypothetical protein
VNSRNWRYPKAETAASTKAIAALFAKRTSGRLAVPAFRDSGAVVLSPPQVDGFFETFGNPLAAGEDFFEFFEFFGAMGGAVKNSTGRGYGVF